MRDEIDTTTHTQTFLDVFILRSARYECINVKECEGIAALCMVWRSAF